MGAPYRRNSHDKNQKIQPASQSPTPGDVPAPAPALKRLEALVGEWTTEIVHPTVRPNPIRGRSRFEWLTKSNNDTGGFLVRYDEVEHPDFPDSVTLIGADADASADLFTYHYFDSRGVERILAMSLRDGVWKLWRDAPGFSQRLTGTFSDDGNAITCRLEKSRDGSHWEHDFDLTYTKVEANNAAQARPVQARKSTVFDAR
jgi:hypothetical protein